MFHQKIDHIKAILDEQFGKKVLDLEQIHSGNNVVLKLRCEPEDFLIAKIYPRSEKDPRDRIGVEFRSLSFLWSRGIRAIPQPLYADWQENFALYNFIPGTKIPSSQVTAEDVNEALEFLRDLAKLRKEPESASLPPASEACFCPEDYLEIIDRRLDHFKTSLRAETPLHRAAEDFLSGRFIPFLKSVQCWHRQMLAEMGIAAGEEMDPALRTLNPSDFGFHNAIRLPDRRLVFFDFEYFGWDDPAKMIADFLHHPGSPLPARLKDLFISRAAEIFSEDADFRPRLELALPLTGLKWCLILLNEFQVESMERRRSAKGALVPEETLSYQLEKAKEKLGDIQALFRNCLPEGSPCGR
ncbi:MAG: phosphotransferase [Planctomycetes bacterium]|nr:phosphotransferase [Planctomycetota bacterium]